MSDRNLSNMRPKQVVLVGLGGVGSRTVDAIMAIIPPSYKPYALPIAIDTDLGDLKNRISHIPQDHCIALGSVPGTGNSVSVGEYLRDNPEATDWFVKGGKLNLIESRNTADGAKQIRMVSRIALDATDQFCGMTKKLEDILQKLNRADGTTYNSGVKVVVVCSVAGGTGAGTVLQFPLYLEQALSKSFSDEQISMECAMLLPNVFSRTLDPENLMAARANAYAVIRELMSMNSGRLKRGDVLPGCDFGQKANYKSPYGRVMFFDDVSMAGDSLELVDLDHVYVPKTAKALSEYLFGAAHGKLISSMDNTLYRLYVENGEPMFGSIGTSKLAYPRGTYIQYALSNWVNNAISEDWLDVGYKADIRYKKQRKQAVDNGTRRPDEWDRRKLYCQVIDEANAPFYREIKARYFPNLAAAAQGEASVSLYADIVEEFVERCRDYLIERVVSDGNVEAAKSELLDKINEKGEHDSIMETFSKLQRAIDKAATVGEQYEIDIMRPTEAEKSDFYVRNDQDEKCLFNFIRDKKLHPVMIRYFLYQLYEKLKEEAAIDCSYTLDKSFANLSKADMYKAFNKEAADVISIGSERAVMLFAKEMVKDLEIYIQEIEDMFNALETIILEFERKKVRCINSLVPSNPVTGTILAGGELSMKYVWEQIARQISDGEDVYTIDDELNLKIHETIYQGMITQLKGMHNVRNTEDTFYRVRTRYDVEISKKLQTYYSKMLADRYAMFFPESVISAALLECGLQNRYKDERSRAENPEKFTYDVFLNRGSGPLNFARDEDLPSTEFISDARYFRILLEDSFSNSKPYCGRVDESAGRSSQNSGENDSIIQARHCIAHARLRREEDDPSNSDAMGVSKKYYNEREFIDGVSTNSAGEYTFSTEFVESGISMDELVFVTTITGLKPAKFVAFLPPDDEKHAPTKEQTYYMAYRNLISKMAIKDNYLTPHLHRNWHLADMLDDLTVAHTDSYNRSAAIAFIYGFVFDAIKVVTDGVVRIGEMGVPQFESIFGSSGKKDFPLLDPSVHARVNNDESSRLTADSIQEKRNTMNSVLVKLMELLATSQPIREAIISYCEEKMATAVLETNPVFVKNCIKPEHISGLSYDNVLDIIDGYYQGTRQISYHEANRGIKNATNMFRFILEKCYETAKLVSSDASTLKVTYTSLVGKIYATTVCDDLVKQAVEETGNRLMAELSVNSSETERDASIDDIIFAASKKTNTVTEKPFAKGGEFSQEVANDMFEIFIKD